MPSVTLSISCHSINLKHAFVNSPNLAYIYMGVGKPPLWRMTSTRTCLCMHLSAGCMCVACCVLCTCELMYVMSFYYVLYHHVPVEPSRMLHACVSYFSVLFLVCLELSIKDASSSPCIRSCLVCNIFSYPSLCAYSPSNTGLVVSS